MFILKVKYGDNTYLICKTLIIGLNALILHTYILRKNKKKKIILPTAKKNL